MVPVGHRWSGKEKGEHLTDIGQGRASAAFSGDLPGMPEQRLKEAPFGVLLNKAEVDKLGFMAHSTHVLGGVHGTPSGAGARLF